MALLPTWSVNSMQSQSKSQQGILGILTNWFLSLCNKAIDLELATQCWRRTTLERCHQLTHKLRWRKELGSSEHRSQSWRVHLSWPNHCPKALSPNTIVFGIRISTYGFGVGEAQTFRPLYRVPSTIVYIALSLVWNRQVREGEATGETSEGTGDPKDLEGS